MDVADALNKLCKWRGLLAGWVAGTRKLNDPGVQGLRDMQDSRLIMRAELTSAIRILIEKRVCTFDEYEKILTHEALELDKMYEMRFPGFKTDQRGMIITDQEKAKATFKKYNFPE